MTDEPRRAREWAAAYRAHGEDDGYFEAAYREAGGDAARIPWADLVPNAHLTAWLDGQDDGVCDGAAALVIGCGLGDDAEDLARRGCRVTACDISPTALAWARRRFPTSSVDYREADVCDPPPDWRGAFALVVEIYTLGVLPGPRRQHAYRQMAACVAPGGRLVVVARRRDVAGEAPDDPGGPPWSLTRTELATLADLGFVPESWDDIHDTADEPPVERQRVVWRAPGRGGRVNPAV